MVRVTESNSWWGSQEAEAWLPSWQTAAVLVILCLRGLSTYVALQVLSLHQRSWQDFCRDRDAASCPDTEVAADHRGNTAGGPRNYVLNLI